MSFFSSLGKKVSGAVHHLGQKAKQVVTRGTKYLGDHSSEIAGIAHKVSSVAGVVGNIAGAVATGAAAMGLAPVAAGAGALAGLSKGVEKGASLVGNVADAYTGTRRAAQSGEEALKAIRSGDVRGAIQAGKEAKAGFDLARSAGGNVRKQIQR